MYSLLVCLIITIGIIAIIFHTKKSKEDRIYSMIVTLVVSTVVYLITVAAVRDTAMESKHQFIEYGDLEIVSLSKNTNYEMDGHFFLGCGSVHGETIDYYVTYGKFEKGLKRVKLDSYNVYIDETNSEHPKIKNYFSKIINPPYKSKWWWNNEKRTECRVEWYTATKDLILVVPENTIIKEFNKLD